jgi:hypothetical protein
MPQVRVLARSDLEVGDPAESFGEQAGAEASCFNDENWTADHGASGVRSKGGIPGRLPGGSMISANLVHLFLQFR